MRRGASNKLEPLPNIFQEYVMGSRLERLLDLSETVTEQEQKVYGFGKRSVEAGIGSIVRRNV